MLGLPQMTNCNRDKAVLGPCRLRGGSIGNRGGIQASESGLGPSPGWSLLSPPSGQVDLSEPQPSRQHDGNDNPGWIHL